MNSVHFFLFCVNHVELDPAYGLVRFNVLNMTQIARNKRFHIESRNLNAHTRGVVKFFVEVLLCVTECS